MRLPRRKRVGGKAEMRQETDETGRTQHLSHLQQNQKGTCEHNIGGCVVHAFMFVHKVAVILSL